MKYEKGVTLATVILVVIVIVIIASTSIIVGNRLILDAKAQKADENYRIVTAAIQREIAKSNTAGIITPGYDKTDYIGINNPIIDKDDYGNSIYAGKDWYLLDETSLEKLGVKNIDTPYLVNYDCNYVCEAKDYLKDCVIVNFNTDGGELDQTTKLVITGNKYGELPTPTKEGYTFMGWNGKNKLNLAEFAANRNYYKISSNEIRIIKSNSNYKTPNDGNFLVANMTYTISGNIAGTFTNRIYAFFGHSLYYNKIYDDNKFISTFIYSSTSDKARLYICQNFNDNPSIVTNLVTDEVIFTNIQLEEGSVATEYEPYYVTSDVKVTQKNNHTLKAIWEPNN